MTQTVLIANTRTGIQRDVTNFLIPRDAYVDLNNAYPFRGRTRRRNGVEFIDRLVTLVQNESVGSATGASFSGTLANIPIAPLRLNITVGGVTFVDNGNGILVGTPNTNTGTINYATGAITLSFSPALGGPTAVLATYSFFDELPVMGLRTREVLTINEEQSIAFDTRKSNLFSNALGAFRDITFYRVNGAAFSWSGDDTDFFWTTNYQGAFFATNNVIGRNFLAITNITTGANAVITYTGGDVFQNGDQVTFVLTTFTGTDLNGLSGTVTAHAAGTITTNINTTGYTYVSGGFLQSLTRTLSGDGIKWFDSGSGIEGWANFQPPVNATQMLLGALVVVPYKGYFLAFSPTLGDTVSGNDQFFQNQVRWSGQDFVFYNSLLPTSYPAAYKVNTWRADVPGNGGFLNAPTQEQFITCEFIKDTLICYFERSTFQLRFTGDPTNPFEFQKINTELGVESTFSIVPFDNGALGIGNVGVITCDSVNVIRVDEKIPDEVFQIHNGNDGPKRVYGIRDFKTQVVYWTFPDSDPNPTFPTNVLVYNYIDQSWGLFDDSVTCFGYFQPFADVTWADLTRVTWLDANFTWESGGIQSGVPTVIAGNQQGFVFKYNQGAAETDSGKVQNDPTLFITNISQASPAVVTSPNHNLMTGTFIKITNVQGMTEINSNDLSPNGIYYVKSASTNTFALYVLNSNDEFDPLDSTGFDPYIADGLIAVQSNFSIRTKAFSPYIEQATQTRLTYVDIFMDGTRNGEFTVNIYRDQQLNDPVQSKRYTPVTTTGQAMIWKRGVYNARGQFITIELTMNNREMWVPTSNQYDFSLQALQITFDPGGRFMYGKII